MSRRARALAVVLCVVGICRGGSAQSPSVAGNLIANGSFEQPALAPWIASGAAVGQPGTEIPAADGSTSLALNSPTATIAQTIATVPGQAYTLSFYAAPLPSDDSHSLVDQLDAFWGGARVKRVSATHLGN